MNTFLWFLQGILAFIFFTTGIMKLSQKKDAVLERRGEQMGWVADFSQRQLYLIGVLEILGVIGLILPPITGVLPILVPFAAVGLGLVMLGASITHLRRGETPMIVFTIILMLFALGVAYGRLISHHL